MNLARSSGFLYRLCTEEKHFDNAEWVDWASSSTLRLALAEKKETENLSCAIGTDRAESDACFPEMGQYDIPSQAKWMGNWHVD